MNGRFLGRLYPWRWSMFIAVLALAAWFAQSPLLSLLAAFALAIGTAAHNFVSIGAFQGFGGFHFLNEDWPEIAAYFGEHVKLTVEGVVIALGVALPIGIVVHRAPWLNFPVFGLLDCIYVLPSLAVFPVLVQFTHLTDTTVLIGVVAYAQFILVRNVVVGLDSVPTEAKEAGRGMGMNAAQILARIELPLAMPVIVAGLRIATVAAIGIAAIAGLVGIPDLGTIIYQGALSGTVNSHAEVEAGAIAVTVLALGADLLLRVVEHYIPANRINRAQRMRVFWIYELFGRRPMLIPTENAVLPGENGMGG
jgi:osmoprotectant transport system permease protein